MGGLPATIGPYRIVRLLGEGGMGAVYEALHETIERRVAIKVLLPEYAHHRDMVARFFNEARAVNRIEHPSLVQVSDFAQTADGAAYLVMEYLRGETLIARLERLHGAGQRLSLLEVLQVSSQIADALAAAHDKTIVHRDLKPANVMLVHDPIVPGGERAKILDFGIAKLTQGTGKSTHTHAVMGTPQYMSPEQCRGAGEVDHKTDVYALGVMIYEMLAGRLPFLGEGNGEFIGQHLFKEPPPVSQFAAQLPAAVAVLVHRLLQKDRVQRPAMREVGRELAKLLASMTGAQLALRPAEQLDADATHHSSPVAPLSVEEMYGQTLQAGVQRARSVRMAVVISVTATLAASFFSGYALRALWRGHPPQTAAAAPRKVAQLPATALPHPIALREASKEPPRSMPLLTASVEPGVLLTTSPVPVISAVRPVKLADSSRPAPAPQVKSAPAVKPKPAGSVKPKVEHED